jgi:hypothetical protein
MSFIINHSNVFEPATLVQRGEEKLNYLLKIKAIRS